MIKDFTYKQKIALLQPWMPVIAEAVKKHLKNEHLRKDKVFAKKYFSTKNIDKLSPAELAAGYSQGIQEEENGESIAEFIANRWLLKNTDLYDFFETNLKNVNPDFTEIQELESEYATSIIEKASKEHSLPDIYLFAVFNSVVFPKEIFDKLEKSASALHQKREEEIKEQEERLPLEKLIAKQQLQIARLVDKYEKKIAGFEKKYHTDVAALKKQIAALQKK